MPGETFMYGDLSQLDGPPEEVVTALLVGFQGQKQLMTGTRSVLWREFMTGGQGGHGCNGAWPVGWHYYLPQELGLTELDKAVIPPGVQQFLDNIDKKEAA